MGAFVDFLVNNYIIFLLVALVLIFALIGYLAETKKKGPKEEKTVKKEKEKTEEISLEDLKSLEGKSLGQAVEGMMSDAVKEVAVETEIPTLEK